jgi:hypothetical protein
MTLRWVILGVAATLYCSPGYGAVTKTVNTYTPAEEKRADDAARTAGYAPGIVTMAQAGNLFLNATRDGRTFSLTVTPDEKIYASTPSGSSPAG